MHAPDYIESLRRILADLCLLDSGWRPGKAELEGARSILHFTIMPPKNGAPLNMIALCSILHENQQMMVTSIFDLGEGWARTFDEWAMVGNPPRTSSVLDPNAIRLRGRTWLQAELQRVQQLAIRHRKPSDGSVVGRQIGKQLVELRRARH